MDKAKPDALDSAVASLNQEALQELRVAQGRISDVWLAGTYEVLKARNPDLLSEMDKAESVIDSLLVIPSWPPVLRKQWGTALANYETTAMQCVTYAKRHAALASPQGKQQGAV